MNWQEKLKAALAVIAEEAVKGADKNQQRLTEALKTSEDAVKALTAQGGDGPGALEAFRASVKGEMDKMAEQIRMIQKLGLTRDGLGVAVPKGRAERIAMLADGRAFLDDQTARRFGAYWTYRVLGHATPALTQEVAKDVCKAAGDMDPGVGAAGEYAIPDEFRAELVRNVEAVAVVFTQMRRVPLTTIGQTTWPKRTGGLTAYPTAAMAAIQKSAPTLDVVTMQPVKWATLTGVANEFFTSNSLVDVGQWLGIEIAYSMAYAFDNAALNGDGGALYGGITGVFQSATIGAITAAAHTTGATIDGDDVSKVIEGLPKAYALPSARWYMSLSMKGRCRSLKSTAGTPLYLRGGNGEPNTIDDYPYVVSQHAPAKAAVTTGTKWCAFGDLRMSHYWGMIGDVRIDTSKDFYFGSDMTAVKGVALVDCKEVDANAVVTGKTY